MHIVYVDYQIVVTKVITYNKVLGLSEQGTCINCNLYSCNHINRDTNILLISP